MKNIILSERVPIKMWLDEMEGSAIQQAKNLANLPFIYRHLAIMPDAHSGFGMPIGGVFAAVDVIVPNAVGVDIGCGMCAVRSNLNTIGEKKLRKIVGLIKQGIPVGTAHHPKPQDESLMPLGFDLDELRVVKSAYESAKRQIGTLGSGNHFIEIQQGMMVLFGSCSIPVLGTWGKRWLTFTIRLRSVAMPCGIPKWRNRWNLPFCPFRLPKPKPISGK